jgi:hypothetical protein
MTVYDLYISVLYHRQSRLSSVYSVFHMGFQEVCKLFFVYLWKNKRRKLLSFETEFRPNEIIWQFSIKDRNELNEIVEYHKRLI